MLNYHPSGMGSSANKADSLSVDLGLRAYMLSIYNYMAVGVAITGLSAYLVYLISATSVGAPDAVAVLEGGVALTSIGHALFVSNLRWLVILAPFAPLLFFSMRLHTLEVSTAQGVFWLYSALVGVSLAVLMLVYTGESITSTFFITSASFGALSLYGYTTKKSLTGLGSFMMMGLFGLLIAIVVNWFIASSALQFAISVVGVLVFAGLTAYDTQSLKNQYLHSLHNADETTVGRVAVHGALRLYLDFLNMFVFLLQLFGQRRA